MEFGRCAIVVRGERDERSIVSKKEFYQHALIIARNGNGDDGVRLQCRPPQVQPVGLTSNVFVRCS